MKLCAQAVIHLPADEVWQRMLADFPSDQRRVGPVRIPRQPRDLQMEFKRWDEGSGFTILAHQSWYIKALWLKLSLEALSAQTTCVTVTADLESILNPMVQVGYFFYRKRINRYVITTFAQTRYTIETGDQVTPENRASIPTDEIEIIDCR
ncbi:MAG TPA: hypothetical protein VHD90_01260 [Phototrophicaceae bacterium]|nr:hypothetical protein [Phototrophicaceae bacterium]